MPIIRIDFDKQQAERADIEKLSRALQQIVSRETDIKDVFVYVADYVNVLDAAPIEIFVEMSAHIMEKNPSLKEDIVHQLKEWKSGNNFSYPINLTLIPMNWEMEIGI